MIKAFLSMWKNTLNFTGSTSIREYWLALAANVIMMYVGIIPIGLLFTFVRVIGFVDYLDKGTAAVFLMVYILIFFVPIIAMTVRRMRDTGFSWYPLVLLAVGVPALGVMIIGILKKRSDNKWDIATKISWCLMAVGAGAYLWIPFIMMLSERTVADLALLAGLGLFCMMAGMLTGAINILIKKIKEILGR